MGRIASASTVYATAYLTEKGRNYLFNKGNIRFDENGNDLFEVLAFGLGDPDVNYLTSSRLESGDIPDITGKSEDCIKATADYTQSSYVYYSVDAMAFVDPAYSTDIIGNILTLNTDAGMPVNSATDVPPSPPPVVVSSGSAGVTNGGFGVPGGNTAVDNGTTSTATTNTGLGGGITTGGSTTTTTTTSTGGSSLGTSSVG